VQASTEKSLGHPYPLLQPVDMARQAVNPRVVRMSLKEDTFMVYNRLNYPGKSCQAQSYNRFSREIILFEPLFSKKVNRKSQINA
jgi:hypothetical protein